MKKLLTIVIVASPIFSGDVQKIIKKIESQQPASINCTLGQTDKDGFIVWKNCTTSFSDDAYTLFKDTPRVRIDAWYAALKEAEQFINKNNPTIISEFNKVRDKSNTVINAMKTVYNHTMSDADLSDPLGYTKAFKDKASMEKAMKILRPVQAFERESLDYHARFPQLLKEIGSRKRGFFDTKQKNADKAELLLERIKDVVAQQVLSLLQSFQMVKEAFK